MKNVYIAGPMRGIPLFNFPAFDDARNKIDNTQGLAAVSPADIDRQHGFDPATLPEDYDWNVIPESAGTMREIIGRDLRYLMDCQAIYLLPGWQNSKGAKAELALAQWLGFDILGHPDALKILGPQPNEDILEEALRITSGDRQAAYGPPDQDFRRTANMWSALFRDMLKDDVAFKPFHVAQAMILLKMSRQLHQRKRDNWTDSAGYARCGWICDQTEQGLL